MPNLLPAIIQASVRLVEGKGVGEGYSNTSKLEQEESSYFEVNLGSSYLLYTLLLVILVGPFSHVQRPQAKRNC